LSVTGKYEGNSTKWGLTVITRMRRRGLITNTTALVLTSHRSRQIRLYQVRIQMMACVPR